MLKNLKITSAIELINLDKKRIMRNNSKLRNMKTRYDEGRKRTTESYKGKS